MPSEIWQVAHDMRTSGKKVVPSTVDPEVWAEIDRQNAEQAREDRAIVNKMMRDWFESQDEQFKIRFEKIEKMRGYRAEWRD